MNHILPVVNEVVFCAYQGIPAIKETIIMWAVRRSRGSQKRVCSFLERPSEESHGEVIENKTIDLGGKTI